MAGITKLLDTIRSEFAHHRSATRVRMDAQQKEIDELRSRVDKLDKPAETQTRTPSRSRAKKSPKKAARNKVPAPDRPSIMQEAGVGKDPR